MKKRTYVIAGFDKEFVSLYKDFTDEDLPVITNADGKLGMVIPNDLTWIEAQRVRRNAKVIHKNLAYKLKVVRADKF